MEGDESQLLTIEEAVALLVNLDYVPAGLTVQDMTEAFLEEAEVELHNARIDRRAKEGQALLEHRVEICKHRHQLAQAFRSALARAIQSSSATRADEKDIDGPIAKVKMGWLRDWASDRFGIGLSPPASVGPVLAEKIDAQWADVEIKIYAEYRIGWRVRKGRVRNSSYRELGLMGVRKHEPNKLGLLLLGFAQGKKFPPNQTPTGPDKTAISKLRDSLCKLTGLSGDPFLRVNEADGWRPRFSIVDDRRNADERAKERAIHVSLEPEAPDFKREDDDAGEWLKKNG